MIFPNVLTIFTYISIPVLIFGEEVCYRNKLDNCDTKKMPAFRYLFYDVNPSEGFNLRRDVYMRMAVLAHKLKHSNDPILNSFLLVLPPWSHLMHWGYSEDPEQIPWSTFFDISSLQKFAPVIELHEYFSYLKNNKYTKSILDKVYILQHYEDMFESGNFVDKWSVEKCQKPPKLRFFHYTNITSNNVQCLSFHGPATKLSEVFKQDESRTIMLEHAEVALHDMFGSQIYWQARRSMRFNFELRAIANEFRQLYLNSSDKDDNTYLAKDWKDDKFHLANYRDLLLIRVGKLQENRKFLNKPKRNAIGGPYLAVHLRRRDFLRGRPDDVPDLKRVAEQITEKLEELELSKVFVATDAPQKEYDELNSLLLPKYEIYKYTASKTVEKKYSAGGVAIVDQIICSYARYFIGTSESTFSFRIQEEREILGFPTKVTFNVLCKDKKKCKKPSLWKIVY